MPLLWKRILWSLMGLLVSAALILSIPALNYLLLGPGRKQETRVIPGVSMRQIDLREARRPRTLRRPETARPARTARPSGPRFAMDLGVAGAGGMAVNPELVRNSRGSGGGAGEGVDQKPAAQAPPAFRLPDAVRQGERDARVVVSFCVDAGGRAYDIRVVDEEPAGLGMAEAARDAVQRTSFRPAIKAGQPVSFCGLEQPFEVRFDG